MIRVLRVIEYEYPDHAAYERDSANWTISHRGGDRNLRHMHSEVVRVQQINTQPEGNTQ